MPLLLSPHAKFVVLLISAMTMASCGTRSPASVLGGECKVFEDPGFAVQGARTKDKRWIDGSIEAGIASCGWKRPTE